MQLVVCQPSTVANQPYLVIKPHTFHPLNALETLSKEKSTLRTCKRKQISGSLY